MQETHGEEQKHVADKKSAADEKTVAKKVVPQGAVQAQTGTPNKQAVLKEADRQTRAIMQLEVYKRLAYSAVAIGALLIYTVVWQQAGTPVMVAGIILLVAGGAASVVLYIGLSHARKNVRRMLQSIDVDPDEVRTKKGAVVQKPTVKPGAKRASAKTAGGKKPSSKPSSSKKRK